MSARRRPNANDRRQSKQSSLNLRGSQRSRPRLRPRLRQSALERNRKVHVSQRNRPRPKPRQTLSRPEQNRKEPALVRNKPGLRLRQTLNELRRKKPTRRRLATQLERNNRTPKQKQPGLVRRQT